MFLRPAHLIRVLGLPVVCLALFSVAGGNLAVLQVAAWGRMLWEYSQEEGSFLAGAEKTFSGDYPCSVCRLVAEEKQKEENKPVVLKVDKKAEVFAEDFADLLPRPAFSRTQFFDRPERFSSRSEAPPGPVPLA